MPNRRAGPGNIDTLYEKVKGSLMISQTAAIPLEGIPLRQLIACKTDTDSGERQDACRSALTHTAVYWPAEGKVFHALYESNACNAMLRCSPPCVVHPHWLTWLCLAHQHLASSLPDPQKWKER